ncbi:putative F-box protein At1g32420 [Lycium barbarum]|uniref:putative F-box protein At1g32420 n=1 Tax=Lycium barbarum TaxID=112863 RepID=UPI00293EB353|nr:putative F-box protein At1g32420 [Lycium barbarum]
MVNSHKNSLKYQSFREKKMNFGRMIPQEIIFEIFSWLPAKSLTHFKCVTKFCNSLVSESNFVDIYECRSMTRPSGTKFFVRGGEAFYAVEQKEDGNTSLLRIENFDKLYDRPGTNCFEFVNGLFCFWKFLAQPVAISNPSTREVRFLPHLNLDVSQNNCYYSLGYKPEEKKYKVLLMTPTPKFEQGYCTRNWIFTLGIDEAWRETETVAEFYPFTGVVCISGVNYMFNTYTFDSIPILHNIAAFDVRAENFRIITWYPRDCEA